MRPASRTQLIEAVTTAAAAGRQVSTVGSGHSFSAAAISDDFLIDISALSGVLDADLESGLVKVAAGTVLSRLNAELDRLGLAMPNLGDIDAQTISGAISTGTHGTGAGFANISAQVTGIELLSADGQVHQLDGDDSPERLSAARVAIGSLGVILSVTLQTVPAFNLHRIDSPMPLEQVLADFDRLVAQNEHFEFFVFPYTDTALTICRNRTGLALAPRGRLERFASDVVIENGLGDAALRLMNRAPSMIPKTARFSARFMNQAEQVDVSHRAFANYRTIRFNEMEYALPREVGPDAVAAVLEMIESERFPLGMPIECRVSAEDDALISPSSGRASIYVAVHQHRNAEWRPYFEQIERLLVSMGGRPHWGKRHSRRAPDLADSYPDWHAFQQVRGELDPNRTFSNGYVKEVLGD